MFYKSSAIKTGFYMKVNLNSGKSNNTVNFCALKDVKGIDKIECQIGYMGKKAGNLVIENLKANPAFNDLCMKCDVYVSLLPVTEPSKKKPCLNDKGMHLEIFAQKVNKTGLSGLFCKKNPVIKVSNYKHTGVEAKPYSVAEYMIEHFINGKNGLGDDINMFYKRISKTKK